MIKFTFDLEKENNPLLSHLQEGSTDYFSNSPLKELREKFIQYKTITEEMDALRRKGKTTQKACTGYFGFLWEYLMNNQPGRGGDRNPDRDETHIMGKGDIKAYVINQKSDGSFGFKEKPTLTKIDFSDSKEVVKNKLASGLHIGLFLHDSKSVFNRIFLTPIHWVPSDEELEQMLFEAETYQKIKEEKGYGVFNTHSNFLYEQGIYSQKGKQLIHLKQGGNGKANIKEDGSYHMNFAISNSVANKLILQDPILLKKLQDILDKITK